YLGDHHAAHMDLAGAYFRADQLDLAEVHVRRALELGTPVPGLALNYLGCIFERRRERHARSFSCGGSSRSATPRSDRKCAGGTCVVQGGRAEARPSPEPGWPA